MAGESQGVGNPLPASSLLKFGQQHKQHHEEENERHGAGSGSHNGQRGDPERRVGVFVYGNTIPKTSFTKSGLRRSSAVGPT